MFFTKSLLSRSFNLTLYPFESMEDVFKHLKSHPGSLRFLHYPSGDLTLRKKDYRVEKVDFFHEICQGNFMRKHYIPKTFQRASFIFGVRGGKNKLVQDDV